MSKRITIAHLHTPAAPLNRVPSKSPSHNEYSGVRKRSPNFTNDDRRLLLELIRPHIDIVENKNAEKETCALKKSIWNDISMEYNARKRPNPNDTSIVVRTQAQLKLCYEAIKYKMRKMMTMSTASEDSKPLSAELTAAATAGLKLETVETPASPTTGSPKPVMINMKTELALLTPSSSITSRTPSFKSTSTSCETFNSAAAAQTDISFKFNGPSSQLAAHHLDDVLRQLQLRHQNECQAMKRQRHHLKMVLLRRQIAALRHSYK